MVRVFSLFRLPIIFLLFLVSCSSHNTDVELIELNLQAKEFTKAEEQLNSALKADPQNIQLKLLSGRIKLYQKKYSQAESIFSQCITENYKFQAAYYWLAKTYYEQRKLFEAESEIKLSLSLFGEDNETLLLLAQIFKDQEQFDKAVAQTSVILRKTPDHLPTKILREELNYYRKTRSAPEIIQEVTGILNADSTNVTARFLLAKIYIDQGMFAAAQENIEIILDGKELIEFSNHEIELFLETYYLAGNSEKLSYLTEVEGLSTEHRQEINYRILFGEKEFDQIILKYKQDNLDSTVLPNFAHLAYFTSSYKKKNFQDIQDFMLEYQFKGINYLPLEFEILAFLIQQYRLDEARAKINSIKTDFGVSFTLSLREAQFNLLENQLVKAEYIIADLIKQNPKHNAVDRLDLLHKLMTGQRKVIKSKLVDLDHGITPFESLILKTLEVFPTASDSLEDETDSPQMEKKQASFEVLQYFDLFQKRKYKEIIVALSKNNEIVKNDHVGFARYLLFNSLLYDLEKKSALTIISKLREKFQGNHIFEYEHVIFSLISDMPQNSLDFNKNSIGSPSNKKTISAEILNLIVTKYAFLREEKIEQSAETTSELLKKIWVQHLILKIFE